MWDALSFLEGVGVRGILTWWDNHRDGIQQDTKKVCQRRSCTAQRLSVRDRAYFSSSPTTSLDGERRVGVGESRSLSNILFRS